MKSENKVLFIQTAFIGDVILATSMIEKWNHHYPSCQIDFLLRKGNENILSGHPFIHEVLIWDKGRNKTKNLYRLIQKVRKNSYDYVINIQRFASTGLLTALSGARTTIGFNKNPISILFSKRIKHQIHSNSNLVHETERNHTLIADLTDRIAAKPAIYPGTSHLEKIEPPKHYVCVAPASVWFTKQLPEEKWIELVHSIPIRFTIYLLGSLDDHVLCKQIQDKSKRQKVFNMCGRFSLLESAGLMADAKMNFVNDSAPAHLASAVNAPVTAFFCSTVPAFGFYPISDQSYIAESEKDLDCRPCGLHGKKKCPKGHFNCGDINLKQILDSLPKALR